MGIVLKINNREIEDKELEEEWELVKQKLKHEQHGQNNDTQPSAQVTLRYAKENIVNRVLLEEEADLMVDEIDYHDIQQQYEKVLSHFGGWDNILSHFGEETTPYKIKSNIEKSLKVDKLLEMWTENIAPPNEAEMMSHYEHNQEKFMSPQQVLFSKFFLSDAKSKQNQILIEGLSKYREQQKDYRDFLEKALKIPNLDYQEKFYLIPGHINSDIEKILLSLADDEISGIIQTNEGFSLFKRWSAIPPRALEYDQVREIIEKKILEEKKQKKIREHLNLLRKQAMIEDLYQESPQEGETL